MFMVQNISIGQLGYLSEYATSQLLHTCSLAECEKLERVLDFIATTGNNSILLLLNPEHSSHWDENELCPSQNQDSYRGDDKVSDQEGARAESLNNLHCQVQRVF